MYKINKINQCTSEYPRYYRKEDIFMKKKIPTLILAALFTMSFVACGSQKTATKSNSEEKSNTAISSKTEKSNTESENKAMEKLTNLKIRFGPSGNAFTLNLYNNDTAAAIARYVGETDWNLPIYHFDDFENHEVMQYYDIPSRFKITSKPETVTAEKAGELYYAAPNRIILFYQDAQVKGEFTKVGSLENTDGLKEAVEKNPVVQGWSNKIVSISPVK